MTRQAWVFLLSAVALQACLNAAKTDALAQHPLSAVVHDKMDLVTERVDGAEERGPFRPLIKTPADILFDQIVKTKKYYNKLFTLKAFHDWYDEMTKYYGPSKAPAHMVTYLVRLFGLNLFQRAMNYGKLNGGGFRTLSIENAQLEYWKKKEITALGLFELLRISDQIELNPSWSTWKKYVQLRYPDKDPYGVLILEAYDSYDEKTFADFIMKMWMTNRRKFAEVAIDAKLITWQREGLSEQDVYKLLELDKSDAPLSNRILSMWRFYTEMLRLDTNAKLFSHLQERYKKEKDLANAVIAYEIVGGGHIEGSLTENLLKDWAKSGKSNVGVAELISLDQPEHRKYKLEMVLSFCVLTPSKRCLDVNHLKQLWTLLA